MKKIILILIILSAYYHTKAQPYQSIFSKNTTFNILISQGDINWSNDSVFAINDTIINNKNYKRLTNWGTINTQLPFEPDFQTDYYFLREDTTIGKTYGLDINSKKEFLLMDLTLNIGDTFWFPNFDKINGDSVAFKVDSVTYFSGKKIIIFKDNLSTNGIQSIYKIKFIEGIGPTNGLIAYKRNIPQYPIFQMRYCMYLLCSHDNTNQTIEYTSLGCKVDGVGINEFDAKDKIRLKVYPNPATDFLKIEIDGVIEDNPSVFIYNAFGKEIIRLNDIKKETYTFQINNLSKGIYFYKLKSKKVQNIYGKFIIN